MIKKTSISRMALLAGMAVLTLSLGYVATAYAATLNLNSGDSVVIQPNVATTVTCNATGGPTICEIPISIYESRYQTCKRSYPSSTCFNNEWPAFKSRHPSCVLEAFDACIKTCGESYPSSTCYNNCR